MKNQPSRCLRTSLASMTLFLLMSFQAVALQVAEAQVTDAQIEAQKSPSSALQDNLQIPNTMEQRLAACSQCHGEYGYGNTTDPNIPRLAESPPVTYISNCYHLKPVKGAVLPWNMWCASSVLNILKKLPSIMPNSLCLSMNMLFQSLQTN